MMLEEEGRVIDVKGDVARVQVQRRTSCGSCRACLIIGKGEMVTEAENSIGAKEGEKVRLSIQGSILKAAFVVYIAPLLVLVIGYTIGSLISERAGILMGLVSFGMAFWFIHWYGKTSGKNYEIKITEVIG